MPGVTLRLTTKLELSAGSADFIRWWPIVCLCAEDFHCHSFACLVTALDVFDLPAGRLHALQPCDF